MDDFREQQAALPDTAPAEPPKPPPATPAATGGPPELRRQRPHFGSMSFLFSACALAIAAVLVLGLWLASARWPEDRTPPSNVPPRNPYSKHLEREMIVQEQRARITTRDPDGPIVIFPGYLEKLYFPPSDEPKDRLTQDDVIKLAEHLHVGATDLTPETVVFRAAICTPDPESQRRIRARNRKMMSSPAPMPPPDVTFMRHLVPMTVKALMNPAPKTAATPDEAVLLCILKSCHKLPLSEQRGLLGYGIPEAEKYDPISYAIRFANLPPAPYDPSLDKRPR